MAHETRKKCEKPVVLPTPYFPCCCTILRPHTYPSNTLLRRKRLRVSPYLAANHPPPLLHLSLHTYQPHLLHSFFAATGRVPRGNAPKVMRERREIVRQQVEESGASLEE
eukprot:366052-Chlamydomonas_euryale.AAC.21